jgi:hypothetical protein
VMDGPGSDCFPNGSLEKVSCSASPKDPDSEVARRAGKTDEVNAHASDSRLARSTVAAEAIMVRGTIAPTAERLFLPQCPVEQMGGALRCE